MQRRVVAFRRPSADDAGDGTVSMNFHTETPSRSHQLMTPATRPPQHLPLLQYTTAGCVLLHSTVQHVHHRAFQTQTLRKMIVNIRDLIIIASIRSMNSLYLKIYN